MLNLPQDYTQEAESKYKTEAKLTRRSTRLSLRDWTQKPRMSRMETKIKMEPHDEPRKKRTLQSSGHKRIETEKLKLEQQDWKEVKNQRQRTGNRITGTTGEVTKVETRSKLHNWKNKTEKARRESGDW